MCPTRATTCFSAEIRKKNSGYSSYINPFMPGGFFCFNSLDRFIFNIRGVCLFFVFSCFVEISALNANRIDPDQTPHSAASDLGLHWS